MTETLDGARRPRLLDLVASIPRQVSRLVRDELRAAQAELTTKLKAAGVGAGLLAGGLVLLLFAINALLASAILGLAMVLPAWLSALTVGVVLAIIAAVLTLVGVRKLKAGVPPVPTESIDSVKEDIRTVKGTMS
ncbi:MAG: phage holin family protein [Microbacteriaceae bacterium]|jgi:hypothetical protein|nr:phage holin family protein [Microbacteriaceae bacterium]